MAQANVTNTLVVPAQTKVAPYFDDFDETKNFHRILFRPGYAVQARELTQLQTILQNQIERFGRHIFVNGSSVIGGKLDIADIITLNVQPEFANSVVDIASFKNKTIRLASGGSDILARVIQTSAGTTNTPPALHIKYLTGTEFPAGATITTTTNDVSASLAPTSNVSSEGKLAFLYDSIYFMQGAFVKVPAQVVVLSKHDRVPTAKVGLELLEEFITESADSSLLDPALESSNYQAPGATRYKLTLNLAARDINSEDDERFIQIARIENGVIKERVTTPTYSEIEEVLARRTYDESGNYIVKPFILRLEESVANPANNFVASISPGKAYLYGFETETPSALYFEVPKARDFTSRADYDLNMNYGNYVLVDNLKGTFNTGMGVVDLHCVTADKVNVANSQLYNSTKIGTARVKDINFYSGSSNVAQRTFEFYFNDNKFNGVSSNAGGLTVANNQIHLGNTVNISSVNDAYTNAIITIVSGNSAGDIRQIVSYNGATKVANVDIRFTENTGPTSNYVIGFDITDVDSFYQSRTYTTGATSNASASVSLLSKAYPDYNADTIVTEPNFLDGLFVYPKKYIKDVTNSSYVYRKVYNSIQFASGQSSVITASTDEEFEGASSSSNTSSTVMDNWLVIVTDKLTSSRNVGDQIPVTTSITTSIPEQAVLSTGNTSDNFIATVYAKVNVSGAGVIPRVKTLVLANTQTFTSEVAAGNFVNSQTGSNTTVYLDSGQVVIEKPSGTELESLYISDVIDAVKIYATTAYPTAGQNFATTAEDVTDRYILDIGQRRDFYDHAKIKLKPGFANPTGYITVCLRYYKSTNDIGYFSVNSYPFRDQIITEEGRNIGTGYALIPEIQGIKMSDVIDFRPVRPNASNTEFFGFNSVRTPVAVTDFRSDFDYYLERWDIFTLNIDKKIERIQGLSAENPQFPIEPERSLILHRMRIKPYTENLGFVETITLNHRRYTMKDISNIDQRLKNVEYSVSLNSLEKRAEDILIKDADGLDRTKYGILAESFTSHLLGDVNSPDYSCSIDLNGVLTPTEGLMMPRLIPREVSLEIKKDTSRNISVHDDKVLLSYTTIPAISQTTATKTVPVAEFLFADFRGNIICTPEGDIWKDTTNKPPTVITLPEPPPVIPPKPWQPTNQGDPIPSSTKVDKLVLLTNSDKYGGLADGTGFKVENGVVQTAGFSDKAFTSFMTDALNQSGLIGYTVDLSKPGLKEKLDAVHDSYFKYTGRPLEVSGAVSWLAQAIKNNESVAKINEKIAIGAGASGELSTYVQGNYTFSLNPTVVVGDKGVTSGAGKTNLNFDKNAFAGVYSAGDSGGSGRATVTQDKKAEDFITGLYKGVLGREPDQAGFDAWLGQYKKLGYSQEAAVKIAEGFTNSVEYKAKNPGK